MDVSVIVKEDGTCCAYIPSELYEHVKHFVSLNRDGSYGLYWLDLPFLRRHCTMSLSSESKANVRSLQAHRKEIIASKEIPAEGISELFSEAKKPKVFQLKAMNFVLQKKRALLADSVGLGKTIVALGASYKLFEQEIIDHIIVVCPKSIQLQWRSEIIDTNVYVPDIKKQISVVIGDKKKRYLEYESETLFRIMSYTNVRMDKDRISETFDPERTLVIIDEATSPGGIKNRKTKIAKVFKSLFKNVKYKLAVSATPLENGLHDLFSVAEWIDPKSLGKLKWFEYRFCRIVELPITIKRGKKQFKIKIPKVIGFKNLPEVVARTEDMYIRRTAEDVGLELPNVISMVRRVELTKEAKKIYDDIAGKLKQSDKKILGEIVRLRVACTAPKFVGGKGDDSGKIKELQELLEGELNGEQIIIATEWKKFAKVIMSKLKKDFKIGMIHGDTPADEREITRKRFQDKGLEILLTTNIGNYGLNLQIASVLVNLDLPWNPAKLTQRCGRIYRMGSEHDHIRIINFVAAETIEEKVVSTLNRKGDLFSQIFDPEKLMGVISAMKKLSTDSALRKML